MNTPSLGQSHFFLVCSGKAGQVMHPRKNKKQVSCREIATLSLMYQGLLFFCSLYFVPPGTQVTFAFPVQTTKCTSSLVPFLRRLTYFCICTTEHLFVNPPTQPQNSSGEKNYIALITETIPRNNSALPLPSDLQTSLLGNTTLYNTNQPLELPKKRLKEKKRS